MFPLPEVVGPAAAAAALFVGTDLDDIVVLTLLFVSSRLSGRPRRWQIWTGQYAGIAVLVGVSVVAALGLTVVPDRWVGLLGLVPLAMGLKGLFDAVRGEVDDEGPVTATGFWSVTALTVANGGDNLAVYTPAFRALGAGGTAVSLVVFAVGVALWCLLATWLSSHRWVLAAVERYGRWVVPVVFVGLGVVLLAGVVR